jgi:hypothetical protein
VLNVLKVCEFLAYWLGGTSRREMAALLHYTPRRLSTLLQDGFGRRGRSTVQYDEAKKRWLAGDPLPDALEGPHTAREAVAVLAGVAAWVPEGLPGLACPFIDTNQFRTDPPPGSCPNAWCKSCG